MREADRLQAAVGSAAASPPGPSGSDPRAAELEAQNDKLRYQILHLRKVPPSITESQLLL